MKKRTLCIVILISFYNYCQNNSENIEYKKRVLETIEINFLSSYYQQEGDNASVTGGIGNEDLEDFHPNIIISIPLSDDNFITIDYGISTYTSASSSNGNPFDAGSNYNETTSPWYASSGASKVDTWRSLNLEYTHFSDDRNTIINANISNSKEWDYKSFGFGGGITKYSNNKNTSYSFATQIYLDEWMPIYPKELDYYDIYDGDTNIGFFNSRKIFDETGTVSQDWTPINNFSPMDDKNRNTYSLSFLFSQILNENSQISFFIDFINQKGWLANPLQRVYFSDINNFYIGNPESIPIYTSNENRDVFHLADDIERLPSTRIKIPLGLRYNYFFSENITLRSYYRFYKDDWGVNSHTISLELPMKFLENLTFYPSYRFYTQVKSDYFEAYDQHLSSSIFYTSDYDLSSFRSNQFGFGLKYVDIFTKLKFWSFGLESFDLNYSHYSKNSNFKSQILSIGFKFIVD